MENGDANETGKSTKKREKELWSFSLDNFIIRTGLYDSEDFVTKTIIIS